MVVWRLTMVHLLVQPLTTITNTAMVSSHQSLRHQSPVTSHLAQAHWASLRLQHLAVQGLPSHTVSCNIPWRPIDLWGPLKPKTLSVGA